MKKFFAAVMVAGFAVAVAAPVFAIEQNTGDERVETVKRGAHNTNWAWTEVMDASGKEAGKAKANDPLDQSVGVAAGTVIGTRNAIHRFGAGAIDLITFWIPKKASLITPAEPTLK
jgi:hypothetical protein